jgi:hypothetical protein
MIDDVAQEFLEFLNTRIARYYLERDECSDGEGSYRLKTNAWAVEHVREEFLALFEGRVDIDKSLIGAEEEAKYELSQRPTIRIISPGDPDYTDSSKEETGKTKSFSEFMAEATLKDRAKRRERRRKRLQNNQE